METVLIADFARVEYIYNTHMKQDFPRDELKPLAAIRRMWERQLYDCYQMMDGQQLVGYAYYLKQPADDRFQYLIDYLAIVPAYRSQGYGSIFLIQLTEIIQDAECIVLEVEDPDPAPDAASRNIRQRRLRFYLENGFIETGLRGRVFGVCYRILEVPCGRRHSDEEIRNIYTSLYRSILPAPLYKAFICIP